MLPDWKDRETVEALPRLERVRVVHALRRDRLDLKRLVDADTEQLLGAHIFGASAAELVHLGQAASRPG